MKPGSLDDIIGEYFKMNPSHTPPDRVVFRDRVIAKLRSLYSSSSIQDDRVREAVRHVLTSIEIEKYLRGKS